MGRGREWDVCYLAELRFTNGHGTLARHVFLSRARAWEWVNTSIDNRFARPKDQRVCGHVSELVMDLGQTDSLGRLVRFGIPDNDNFPQISGPLP